ESEKPELDARRKQRHGEKDEHGAEKTHGEVRRPTGAVARVAQVVAGESIADASELEEDGRHEEKSEERMSQKPWAGSRDDLRGEREKENHCGVAGQTCVGLDRRVTDIAARRAATSPITDHADQEDYGDEKIHRVHATRAATRRVEVRCSGSRPSGRAADGRVRAPGSTCSAGRARSARRQGRAIRRE